ncbi:MAG TPA: HemK/PrmC family methyltransferase [Patescibacteria group bacterium]|nr:HemK/PrmC family methyltransferase [Patescibacteria group bacterium]
MPTETVSEFLRSATKQLQKAGIETARLDVLVLLEDALGRDRSSVIAHPEDILEPGIAQNLDTRIAQRAQHIPLAYIRGKAEFYGRTFTVNPHVLVPRPESEALIELLKTAKLPKDAQIADIGTGSGCLGITAALELSATAVDLYDIDPNALEIATQNAGRYDIKATTYQEDLLSGAQARAYDMLLANLPYVPEIMQLNEAAKHEPPHAIFSGPAGLDHYKRFWTQVAKLNHKPHYIVTESLPSQHHALAQLARSAGYYLEARNDFAQLFAL